MDYINKKVIVRCNRAGVFYGTMKNYDSTTHEAVIADCRQLWYWNGAATVSMLRATA